MSVSYIPKPLEWFADDAIWDSEVKRAHCMFGIYKIHWFNDEELYTLYFDNGEGMDCYQGSYEFQTEAEEAAQKHYNALWILGGVPVNEAR